MKRNLAILFLLIAISANIFSQAEKMPPFTIRASCSIPKNITSEMYRHSFGGVYDASVGFVYRLKNNMTCGLGYQNALFVLQKYFKDKPTSLTNGNNWLATRLQTHGGFIRLGYDKSFSEGKKGYFSYVLNAGYSYNKYTSVICPVDSLQNQYPHDFKCPFVKPEITFNFFGEGVENLAFTITFGYTYYFNTYDPNLDCFTYYTDSAFQKKYKDGSSRKYRNSAGMSWFSFGFGFCYGIGKPSK